MRIPASTATHRAVHPRVRGEHVGGSVVVGHDDGPSPRARGTRYPHSASRRCGRSIPACAGNTPRGRRTWACRAVHPRVRGEHKVYSSQVSKETGPSPRARGTPGRASRRRRRRPVHPRVRGEHAAGLIQPIEVQRSIPACAGNTAAASLALCRITVHPRVRGEHPDAAGDVMADPRSIPACAGNTTWA